MIYSVRNPEVAEADRLVYIPGCKSATMLQRYTLECKQLTVPKWLPKIPPDFKGFLAYILLATLASLSAVLLASELGVNDSQLLNVAVTAIIAIFAVQFTVDWYVAWAIKFNYMAETYPVLGIPVEQVPALQILRQMDSQTFDRAVEVMTDRYSGIYNLSHRFSSAIDEYVDSAQPIVDRDYYDQINLTTSPEEKCRQYIYLASSLLPLAENCLTFLRRELEYYEVEMIYV